MANIPVSLNRPSEPLTAREREILSLIARGHTNGEIARSLHLAEKTVKWYNSQIYGKLGVNGRQQAVEQARSLGLLELPAVELRHNLPSQPTPFIGRQTELAELALLLRNPDHRLLTILAPGGMGKTRLALAAANAQLQHFADGVFFVALAAVGSAEDMVTAIAESIGFGFSGSQEPLQQLLNHCSDRALLLVLDNFEHLLAAASVVMQLIQTAARLKILVTSREKLNLNGETVFTLSGMSFPDRGAPGEVLEYDAARLLIQMAHHISPHFQLDPGDDEALARICHLTAGMPLALVLAAGWVDVLTLEQIAAEIQRSLDILETEKRDVPERQHSVQASFDHSWARLTETERACLMKLALFQDGFTVKAAQTVAKADLRQLRRLVDKGMIQTSAAGRHTIHELIRQSILLKLEAAPALKQATLDLHCEYYLTLLGNHSAAILNMEQADIHREIGNLRAAWTYAVAQDRYPLLRKSAQALFFLYRRRSWFVEGRNLFERLLSRLQADQADTEEKRFLLGDVLIMQGCFLTDLLDVNAAEDSIRRGLSVWKSLPLQQNMAPSLARGAHGLFQLGADSNLTERIARQALMLFEQTSERWGMVMVHLVLAGIERLRGNVAQSESHLATAESLNQPPAYVAGIGWAIQTQSYLAHHLGRFEEARKYREQAYHHHAAINYQTYQLSNLLHLGMIAMDMDDDDAAQRYFEQALEQASKTGAPIMVAETLVSFGYLAAYRDDDEGANNYYSRIANQYQMFSDSVGTVRGDSLPMGLLAMLCARYDEGLAYAERARQISIERGYHLTVALATCRAGHCLMQLHQAEQAQQYLEEALRASARMMSAPLVLEALTGLAQLPSTSRLQSIALLTFVVQYPTANRFSRHTAQRVLASLKNEVSAADFAVAVRQGQTLTLESALSIYGVDLSPEIVL